MKKMFKGFTLIECLVALAILGIASLVMAQIYAGVSRTNQKNNSVNYSLAYQMKKVEEATGSDAIPIYYGNTDIKAPVQDTHSLKAQTPGDGKHPALAAAGANYNYIEITKCDTSGNYLTEKNRYSYPVDIYVLLSRDTQDRPSKKLNVVKDANGKVTSATWGASGYDGLPEKDIALRYKYILGHSN